MGKSLITNNLKTHMAVQFKESITETANNTYYLFAGKHTEFANGIVETPMDTCHGTLYDVYDNMVFGKRITDSDVQIMIPRVDWTTNTVYTAFDSDTELFGTNFYVAVDGNTEYHVFKCLDNNAGAASTEAPNVNDTSPSDEFYSTGDGYVWKYMYSIPASSWDKFTTDDYMPVIANTQVSSNAVSGTIDVIRIESGGSNYDAVYSGRFTASQLQVGGNPLLYELPAAVPSIQITAANVTLGSTSFNSNTDVVTADDTIVLSSSNTFTVGSYVKYETATGNTAVSGLSNGSFYYITFANNTHIALSTTYGGANVNLTGAATGESGHYIKRSFANNEVVTQTGSGATGIFQSLQGSLITLTGVSGNFTNSAIITGGVSGATANVVSFFLYQPPNVASANNDFYTDSCIYISTGTGAGQIKLITDYNGTYRRMTVNSAFSTALDETSTYEITPVITVDGDGTGAVARGLVNAASSNSIYKVEIVERGSGYSYASLTIGGNTGGVSNAASLMAILAPRGGHGANAALELGAIGVGIGMKFANNESGKIPTDNDFRTVGIIKDPLFANVELTLTSPTTGTFIEGGTVYQVNTGASGVISVYSNPTLRLTNVSGQFETNKIIYQANSIGSNVATANVASYEINDITKDFSTFDQRFRYVVSDYSGTFQADETVYQNNIVLANGVFHSNVGSYFAMTKVRGVINANERINGVTSGASANVTSRLPPDLVMNTGDVLYLENMDEITRSNNQSEQIKIVLKF